MPHVHFLPAVCLALFWFEGTAHRSLEPNIELQSGPLTPAVVLDESQRPVHQVRLLVEADAKHATLILDPNVPEFDEFGGLVGGIETPQSAGKHGAIPAIKRECTVEFVKLGREKWHLYRVTGAKISSSILVATQSPLLDAGPARLLILGDGKKVKTVIDMTRYGLVVP